LLGFSAVADRLGRAGSRSTRFDAARKGRRSFARSITLGPDLSHKHDEDVNLCPDHFTEFE
jgi:hypothetical protein